MYAVIIDRVLQRFAQAIGLRAEDESVIFKLLWGQTSAIP